MSRVSWRQALAVGAVLMLIVGVAALTPPDAPGLPLDPRSSDRSGTRALVDVLRSLGARVDVVDEIPTDGNGSLLIAFDFFDDAQRRRVRRFAAAGGTVLLLDDRSPLAPPPARPRRELFTRPLVRGCDEPALRTVDSLSVTTVAFEVPSAATGCYVDPDGSGKEAWMVSTPLGDGRLIAVGDGAPFQNARLDEKDNALLAVNLLAPREDARVRMLDVQLPADAEGGTSLVELLPPATLPTLGGLLLAFLLLVAWRARRLGGPLEEPQLVALPASELVVAAGELFARTGARGRAAELLRQDLRRTLRDRLAASPAADDAELSRLAAARAGVSERVVAALLEDDAPETDAELTELGAVIERMRARLYGEAMLR